MDNSPSTISEQPAQRRLSRRAFLKLCGAVAATLALPASAAKTIYRALATAPRLPVVWLEFQDCTGDSESFLRAYQRADPLQPAVTDPTLTDLLLDVISLDYHETIMAPSGLMAEKSRLDTLQNYPGEYLCIVEGSIPAAENGIYCCIGGRTALSIAQEVIGNAKATIALGTCAWEGGLANAAPNPTGAVGVAGAVPGVQNLLVLPGCPANVVNLTASIVYFLTFNQWPAQDASKRPSFAYGRRVHSECPREDHYEDDEYVLAWGDEGHRQGWCLYKMGCRGPLTRSNCPSVKWCNGTDWSIGAGHGCVGCTDAHFWDTMTPFYVPLG